MSDKPIDNLRRVAKRLYALGIADIVFVGGSTIELYLTDPAAPAPRATVDVDVLTPVSSRAEYQKLEARLRAAGFSQPLEEGGPICRWRIDGVIVDLMPPNEDILGFSNRWYQDVVEHARSERLVDGTMVRVATTPYLIATKLEAFWGRGRGEYGSSHDLEDIIIVLDGRPNVVEEVHAAPADVRQFIARRFESFLMEGDFLDALPGFFLPDAASQARVSIVIERMSQIARLAP